MTSEPRRGRRRFKEEWEQAPDVYGLVEDISDALVCREQDQFLLTDPDGNILPDNRRGLGLYTRDTRHLSVYTLLVDGKKPLVLLSTADSGFSQEQVIGNYRMVCDGNAVGRATVEIIRRRVLDRDLEERLQITNYNDFPVSFPINYLFEADFADIFEVRGHTRQHPGNHGRPEIGERSILYRYLGADGAWRRTLIIFDEPPVELSADAAKFEIKLGARESREMGLRVITAWEEEERPRYDSFVRLREDYAHWRSQFATLHTDNELFNQVVNRSINELRMLWTEDHGGEGYFAAGVPWFATLFGRDSIITALQTLALRPELARKCLHLLARRQARSYDPFSVQEPGKILHEMRQSELSAIKELPYTCYYGSVDSTPLFLVLVAEYYHWTGDYATLLQLLPAIKDAIHWVREFGRPKGDVYLRYNVDAAMGLRNQGWKDSEEAIMHADGSLCDGPIALAEVQGYVYRAWTSLAPLLENFGEESLARTLTREAGDLKEAFNRDFWLDDLKRVAMALDGENRPSTVMSSNAGQVLWSGLLDQDRAEAVREALFQNDMFSGWGIRTLSRDCAAYYPLGYHLGTVWPHDNAIIAHGLKRYGFEPEVEELMTALFDAAQHFPTRSLPELFGGQSRADYRPPVPYPVACRPQAWAAGAILHLLVAALGLRADAPNGRLYVVRPRLPFWLGRVDIDGLKVGERNVTLHFANQHGQTVVTARADEGLEVITTEDSNLYS